MRGKWELSITGPGGDSAHQDRRDLVSGRGVHEDKFAVCKGGDANARLAGNGRTVAGIQYDALKVYLSGRRHQIPMACRVGEVVLGAFAGPQRGSQYTCGDANRQGVVIPEDPAC